MRKFLTLIITAIALCGCRSTKNLSAEYIEHESERTEVRTETIYVPDTVYVEIPAQTAERTTVDSLSHLENDYATSDARINPDGTLFHSLATKPQKKPVVFQKPVERKDSIVYVEKVVIEEVEKEKPLSRWEKFKLDYGGYSMLSLLLVLSMLVLARRTD